MAVIASICMYIRKLSIVSNIRICHRRSTIHFFLNWERVELINFFVIALYRVYSVSCHVLYFILVQMSEKI